MFKKVFSMILVLIFCVNTSINVYADSEGEDLLNQINSEMGRRADYSTLVSVYSALKNTGFSDYESAAILVNMNRESSITPDAGQDRGGAIGLIQWDGGRRDNLQAFSKSMNDTEYTIKGYQVGGIGTQVAFILEEFLNQNQWGGVAPCSNHYTSFDYNEAKDAVNDSSIDLSQTVSIDDWRSMTNCVAMSLYFTSQFERCGYGIDIYNEGAKQSLDMYKVITGCNPSTESNKKVNEDVANALALSGFWDEARFAEFSQLVETPLTFPDKDQLSKEQLKGVTDWKNNIEYEEDDGLIKWLRVIIMLFGIIFLVWIVLIYLSYWFDRINNFLDLELLPIITAGRLRVSPEEHECTFNPKSYSKGQAQTVNHRTVLILCGIGIFFSVLVISGKFYTVLNSVVRKILEILGIA